MEDHLANGYARNSKYSCFYIANACPVFRYRIRNSWLKSYS